MFTNRLHDTYIRVMELLVQSTTVSDRAVIKEHADKLLKMIEKEEEK